MNQPDLVVCRVTFEGGAVEESLPKTAEEASAWFNALNARVFNDEPDDPVIANVEFIPTPQMQLLLA